MCESQTKLRAQNRSKRSPLTKRAPQGPTLQLQTGAAVPAKGVRRPREPPGAPRPRMLCRPLQTKAMRTPTENASKAASGKLVRMRETEAPHLPMRRQPSFLATRTRRHRPHTALQLPKCEMDRPEGQFRRRRATTDWRLRPCTPPANMKKRPEALTFFGAIRLLVQMKRRQPRAPVRYRQSRPPPGAMLLAGFAS